MGESIGIERNVILAVVLVFLIGRNLLALPLQMPANEGIERGKRGIVKGLLVGGAVYGGTKLVTHEIKEHNPCAFHNSGWTDEGQMENKIAANSRCQNYFSQYQGQLNNCPNAVSASCQQIGDDTECAVTNSDGTITAVNNCVS